MLESEKHLQSHSGLHIPRSLFTPLRAGWFIALLLCLSSSAWAVIPTQFSGVVSIPNLGPITLSSPEGILVDPTGNVYISDTANNRIVLMSPTGITSVLNISGLAINLPTGLARDASGLLYIDDSGNSRVVQVDSAGNGSVVATGGITLNSPLGVAIDPSGNIFIADTGNNQIVKISAGVASVFTITGLGTSLSIPSGLTTDTAGNLYIADSANNRVVKVTPAGAGSVVPVLGGVTLNNPTGVFFDIIGNLQIADSNNDRIVFLPPNGADANVYLLDSTTLNHPVAVATDVYGKVYIADTNNNRLVTMARDNVDFGHLQFGITTGTIITLPFAVAFSDVLTGIDAFTVGVTGLDFAVIPGSTTCAIGSTNTTCTVDVQFLPTAPGLRRGAVVLSYADGNLTVPVSGMSDAPMATLAPGVTSVLSTGGTALNFPFQVALDGSGNMYVANYSAHNVLKVPAGGGVGTAVNTGSNVLTNVAGVAIDGAGNLFISDHNNSRIVEVPASGISSVLAISGINPELNMPTGLALDGSGNLYISDWQNSRIVKVTPTGVGSVLNTGALLIGLTSDTGVAVDRFGTVYIADRTNNRVIKVTEAGVASVVATTGITPLSNPQGVTVDGMDNLYIVDSGNSRIVEVTTAGVVSVVPLLGLPTPTSLAAPFGVTVDSSGNLIIPDSTNNRLVSVNLSAGQLSYLTTAVGATSTDSPKVATVTNVGDQPLVFVSDPLYPTDFVVNGDPNLCAASVAVAAGNICNIAAKFTPQSVGTFSESVTLTNNALNAANATQQVTLTGIGFQIDTTALTVTAAPATITIGQTTTITALVTDSTTPSTIPTGTVTFSDLVGSTATSLNGGAGVTLDGTGRAILSNVTLSGAGVHTITSNYAGVANSFAASSNTTTVTINKVAVALTGPTTQPVSVAHGQAGSIPLTVPGASGFPVPSGTVTYTIIDSANNVVATGSLTLVAGSSSSTVAVPIANSLASGLCTVSVLYNGDQYYAASNTLAIQLRVGPSTPTIVFTPPTTLGYGTALGSALTNSTATYNSAPVPGTFTYTATLAGGTPFAVTTSTILPAGNYTLTATFTSTDTNTYATAMAQVPLTVNKATLSVTAANATRGYGVANPTFTGTITGQQAGDTFTESFITTATPTSAIGTYSIVPAAQGANLSSYNVTVVNGTLTVTKATVTATITASSTTISPGQSVTLTASVTSAGGTPTGTVSFYDGNTLLGTVALANGTATYTATGLMSGAHSLTITYSGDNNFSSVTAGGSGITLTVSPLDFTLTSTLTVIQSVIPGKSATYTFNLTPTTGTFPGIVTLAVSGLPVGATSSFNPQTLPASSTGGAVALTVQVPPLATASLQRNSGQLVWTLLLLPLASVSRLRKAHTRVRRAGLLMLLLLGSTAVIGLSGCGTSTGIFGQTPKDYTLIITATSGLVQHSINVTLNVQ